LVVAHFLAGSVCAAAGGLVLAGGGVDAREALHPGTLAIAHLWLAGWLSLTAVGVLLQFLPVTSSVTLLSPRLAWVHLGCHVAGIAALAIAFLTGNRTALASLGGAVLWSGLALAAIHLGATLARSRELTVWRAGVFLALMHLIVTPTVGWGLLTLFDDAFVAGHRLPILVAHAHLGLVGWLFTLVVAVGGRLIPMFLVAPEPKPGHVTVTLILVQAGLLALATAVVAPAFAPLGTVLLAVAVGWWVAVMATCLCRRKKTLPDAPMATAASGLALLVLVALAGVSARVRPGIAGWSTYGLLAIAAGGLMTNGLTYRILSFLVRLERFRRLPGNPAVPGLGHVLDTVPHRTQMAVLGAGFLLLVVDAILPVPALNLVGRYAVAAGTLALTANVALLVFGPPRWRALFVRAPGKAAKT
jgi:hypothetical protein